jgi:hypothetical protein
VIVTALVGAAVAWFVISMINRDGTFAVGGAVGTPLGAILGAIASAIYLKLRRASGAIAPKSGSAKMT